MPVALAQAYLDRSLLQADCDDAIITTHWESTTSFDTAKRTLGTTKFKTFWNALNLYISNSYVLKEVRWYDVPSEAPFKPVYVETIPVTSGGAGGTGTAIPPQMAFSITLKTANRKGWGRMYVPGIVTSGLKTQGYLTTALCDAACNAAKAMADRTTEPHLCVWSKTTGVAQDPLYIQVDDVPDVIRSRRFNVTTYRKQLTT